MSSYAFWAHMQQHGQMSRLWWYSFAALPALIVAGGAYLLMLFALRHKQHPPAIFFWLLLASLPALLIAPSFYVSVNIDLALARVGTMLPASAQRFSLEMARQLGAALDQLALGGVAGAALALVVLAAAALVGDLPVASPLVQQISQTLTRAVTRALGPRRAASSGDHGVVRVTRGASAGSQFAVRNASIGKQEADIIITDTVVSRKHARLDVSGGLVRLCDEGSTNGTFVQRGGQTFELRADAFALEHGDVIFLGSPQQSTAVALAYERK